MTDSGHDFDDMKEEVSREIRRLCDGIRKNESKLREQLERDRANLTAILKVIGPLLYGQLFVAGKAIGAPALPFAFNIALTTAALFLVPYALREPDAAGN